MNSIRVAIDTIRASTISGHPETYTAYYRPLGYPEGIYRVGPLARLNLVTSCGTPLADHELGALRAFAGSPLLSSFHYHQARLIEMLHVIERMQDLLAHPDILSPHVRAFAEPNQEEGVGISEAPRGTLLPSLEVHHVVLSRSRISTSLGDSVGW